MGICPSRHYPGARLQPHALGGPSSSPQRNLQATPHPVVSGHQLTTAETDPPDDHQGFFHAIGLQAISTPSAAHHHSLCPQPQTCKVLGREYGVGETSTQTPPKRSIRARNELARKHTWKNDGEEREGGETTQLMVPEGESETNAESEETAGMSRRYP